MTCSDETMILGACQNDSLCGLFWGVGTQSAILFDTCGGGGSYLYANTFKAMSTQIVKLCTSVEVTCCKDCLGALL